MNTRKNKLEIITVVGAVVALLLLLALSCHAATITVTNTADSGAGSLRDALASAADGDTIDATGVSGPILVTTGELVVSNSVTIIGPGSGNLAVDGNAASSVFHIMAGKIVTISSLTITNGFGDGINGFGGGIVNDHATLTVSNCTVSGNSVDWGGGGIYNGGEGGSATLTVVGSTLSGNSVYWGGGGIFNDTWNSGSATLTVSASTLSSNSAYWGGGGIFSYGKDGGSATLTVSASTLSSNSAYSGGGGIFSYGDLGSATLAVSASTLSRNSGGSGGGVFNDGASGGSATLEINASTFCSNSAYSGGGIFNEGVGGSATVEIGDTILKTGASGANIINDSGTVTSRGYNLSSDDGGGFLTATRDQINTNPRLGPLQNNGGPTFTHALLAGSPAVDKGKRNTIPELASDTDQRGFPRPFDVRTIVNPAGGDGSDIGAFEANCPDLTGTWSGVAQSCCTYRRGLRCLLKGSLLVQNIGPIDATASFTAYYLSSDGVQTNMFLKQIPTGTLKSGKSRTRLLTMYLPYGLDPSGQYVISVINPGGAIPECNMNNDVAVFGPLP